MLQPFGIEMNDSQLDVIQAKTKEDQALPLYSFIVLMFSALLYLGDSLLCQKVIGNTEILFGRRLEGSTAAQLGETYIVTDKRLVTYVRR